MRSILSLPARATISSVQSRLKEHGVGCLPLPIRQGFHSPLMDAIEPSLRSLADQLTIRAPQLPVVSCMAGRSVLRAELSPQYWWEVLRCPARFSEAVGSLEKLAGPHLYLDVGPSGTLAGFVRNLGARHPASEAMAVLTPFGNDLRSLARLKEALKA